MNTISEDHLLAIGSSAGLAAAASLAATGQGCQKLLQPRLTTQSEALADCWTSQSVVRTDVTSSNKQCSFGMYGTFEVVSDEVVLERRDWSMNKTLKPFSPAGGTFDSRLRSFVKNHPQVMDAPLFPMHLMRGSQLKALDRLPSYEEAFERGMLLRLGTIVHSPLVWNSEEHMEYMNKDYDESKTKCVFLPQIPVVGLSAEKTLFLDPTKRRIFVSHRWLDAEKRADPHPDTQDNRKLKALKAYLRDDDYVWIDFCCCPQAADARTESTKAIDSLLYYIGQATELLSLSSSWFVRPGAGPAPGRCGYLDRGFAQLELLGAFAPCKLLADSASHHQSGRSGRTIGESRRNQCCYTTSCASIKALVVGEFGQVNSTTIPIKQSVLRNPLRCDFTFEEDRQRVAPLVARLREQFAEAGWEFPGDESDPVLS